VPAALRSRTIQCKITGAALAAAFAAKGKPQEQQLSLVEKEECVVESIREAIKAGQSMDLRRTGAALGQFANASGALAQTWLTPQSCERVVYYWWGGWNLLQRDVRRGRLTWADLRAAPWFLLLLLPNTFPWTPLLVPLVSQALAKNSTGASSARAFVPAPFDERRVVALQRLRGDAGLDLAPAAFRTPQDIDEGVRFFGDGGAMLLRDVRRGGLFARGDTPSTYVWFAFLALSTFPLTPLLIPLIDKRRPDGSQLDYVPTAFRARRLASYARLRASRVLPPRTPAEVIRAAAAADASSSDTPHAAQTRPTAAELLAAIIDLPTAPQAERASRVASNAGPCLQRCPYLKRWPVPPLLSLV
jgi:hypothetical protein